VPDALARMEQLLGAAPGPEAISGNADLWRFLPDAADLGAADLDAADLAPATGPDPALLCRSAAAGTFVAALELARQGWISLAQEEPLGTIIVRARHEPPPSDPDFETASSVPAAR
jgi:chromatin segregation and condensation protein Rec8/ScpA/Scc1 (kleisin family)